MGDKSINCRSAARRLAVALAMALALIAAVALECDFYSAFTQRRGLSIDGSALAQWLRSVGDGLASGS